MGSLQVHILKGGSGVTSSSYCKVTERISLAHYYLMLIFHHRRGISKQTISEEGTWRCLLCSYFATLFSSFFPLKYQYPTFLFTTLVQASQRSLHEPGLLRFSLQLTSRISILFFNVWRLQFTISFYFLEGRI